MIRADEVSNRVGRGIDGMFDASPGVANGARPLGLPRGHRQPERGRLRSTPGGRLWSRRMAFLGSHVSPSFGVRGIHGIRPSPELFVTGIREPAEGMRGYDDLNLASPSLTVPSLAHNQTLERSNLLPDEGAGCWPLRPSADDRRPLWVLASSGRQAWGEMRWPSKADSGARHMIVNMTLGMSNGSALSTG